MIILLSVCVLQSCRQDEMDITPEHHHLVEKTSRQRLYLKTENDTMNATSNFTFDENGNEIVDPPPKDKDQWKF